MIESTSYYLRFKSEDSFGYSFIDCKSLKSLEKEIKRFIDNKITFEVWVQFNFKENHINTSGYGFDNYTSFEIWYYNGDDDEAGTFNLRKNLYLKKLKWYEKRLRNLMLTYGISK